MSVVHFGAEELANVARYVARSGDRDSLDRACKKLALISHANTACYRYRYSHNKRDQETQPVSAEEIRHAVLSDRAGAIVTGLDRAASTVGLLRYNCVEEIDFLEEIAGGQAALIYVLEGIVWAQKEAAERAGKVARHA